MPVALYTALAIAAGEPIGAAAGLVVGVGANPVAVDPAREAERFLRKQEAGAEYAITQPVFDADALFRFLDRVGAAGSAIPILAGLYPLLSFRNADFISMTFPGAAGAMRSTATDLCRWHAALLGGRMVKPGTLKEMLTPARLKSGQLPDAPPRPDAPKDAPVLPMKYGFGLFFGEFEGRDYIEHDGGINGFISHFRSFWPQGITVAALVNTDGLDTPAKRERIQAVRDAAVRAALAGS